MSLRTQKRKISPNSENRSSSRSSLIVNSKMGAPSASLPSASHPMAAFAASVRQARTGISSHVPMSCR